MSGFGSTTMVVCGGAGFIGSNFIRYIFSESPKTKIVCVDALSYAGNKDNLKGFPKERFIFVKGDIVDTKAMSHLFSKYQPAFVINFAAESHVDRSIHGGALDFFRINTGAAVALFDVARTLPTLKKFVHVSTDEVYGSLELNSKRKFNEHSPLSPNSPYAASKAAADLAALAYHATYGVPIVVTRCSNNYGPYQHPEKLIPYSIARLLEGRPIAIYGDGRNVRDWIHVIDHCSALALTLAKGVPGEVYNIGANDEVDNLSLAKQMLSFLKRDKNEIIFVKDRPAHDRRYSIDASKIRKELGWKPAYSFRTSFFATIAWYVHNESWMRRALARAGTANTHV